jgi:hypothetical protein
VGLMEGEREGKKKVGKEVGSGLSVSFVKIVGTEDGLENDCNEGNNY